MCARVGGELSSETMLLLLLLQLLLLLVPLPRSGSDTALAGALLRPLLLDAATLARSAAPDRLAPSDAESFRKKSMPSSLHLDAFGTVSTSLSLTALVLVFGTLLLLLLLPTAFRSSCFGSRIA